MNNNIKIIGNPSTKKQIIDLLTKDVERPFTIDLNNIKPVPILVLKEFLRKTNFEELAMKNWGIPEQFLKFWIDKKGSIHFKTEFCPPMEALQELSRKFPEMKFELRCDGETGLICDNEFMIFENGNIIFGDLPTEPLELINWYAEYF